MPHIAQIIDALITTRKENTRTCRLASVILGDDHKERPAVQWNECLRAERMTFHHDDVDWRFERLSAENIDENPCFSASGFDTREIVVSLGRAVIDQTKLSSFCLDDITKWRKSVFCQRLDHQSFDVQIILPVKADFL